MQPTDRSRFDLYMQVQQNRQRKEQQDEGYLKRLEEGLLNEYRYYKKRRDNSGYCAEGLILEATNKALDQAKEKWVW